MSQTPAPPPDDASNAEITVTEEAGLKVRGDLAKQKSKFPRDSGSYPSIEVYMDYVKRLCVFYLKKSSNQIIIDSESEVDNSHFTAGLSEEFGRLNNLLKNVRNVTGKFCGVSFTHTNDETSNWFRNELRRHLVVRDPGHAARFYCMTRPVTTFRRPSAMKRYVKSHPEISNCADLGNLAIIKRRKTHRRFLVNRSKIASQRRRRAFATFYTVNVEEIQALMSKWRVHSSSGELQLFQRETPQINVLNATLQLFNRYFKSLCTRFRQLVSTLDLGNECETIPREKIGSICLLGLLDEWSPFRGRSTQNQSYSPREIESQINSASRAVVIRPVLGVESWLLLMRNHIMRLCAGSSAAETYAQERQYRAYQRLHSESLRHQLADNSISQSVIPRGTLRPNARWLFIN